MNGSKSNIQSFGGMREIKFKFRHFRETSTDQDHTGVKVVLYIITVKVSI